MATDNQDLNEIAEAFDRQTDPLQEYESKFSKIDVDPFKSFVERVLEPTDPSHSTLKNYRHSFDHWKEFMSGEGRHPACPNESHIKKFAEYLATEQDNADSTIRRKIDNLGRTYAWWQDHYAFPHSIDYDPFSIAKREMDLSTDGKQDKYPPLSEQQVSEVIQNCTNVRERLFLLFLIKLGMRVSELLNIRLEEISVKHQSITETYPSLGTAPEIEGYNNCILIPSKHERDGNKSTRPRILPLDDELRQMIIQYLMIRPMVDEPWLILSQRRNKKINRGDRVNNVWKEHFHEYNEIEEYRDITSHYGRHYFTRYWKIQEGVPRELVQYMRGDKIGEVKSGDSIDDYLEAYYEDIEDIYLDRVPKFL